MGIFSVSKLHFDCLKQRLCRVEDDRLYFISILFLIFIRFFILFWNLVLVSQIRYLLVVILELNSVSEVQYKNMMIDR